MVAGLLVELMLGIEQAGQGGNPPTFAVADTPYPPLCSTVIVSPTLAAASSYFSLFAR